jgi:hypothetical protein
MTYAEALTITTQVVHLADRRTGRIVCWNHSAHTVGVRTWDGAVVTVPTTRLSWDGDAVRERP